MSIVAIIRYLLERSVTKSLSFLPTFLGSFQASPCCVKSGRTIFFMQDPVHVLALCQETTFQVIYHKQLHLEKDANCGASEVNTLTVLEQHMIQRSKRLHQNCQF